MEFFTLTIYWAVWRRVFGGLFNLPRAGVVVIGFFSAATPFYFAFDWLTAVIAGGLSMLFWTPGHDFRRNSELWRRYGHIGIPWMVLERFEGKRPLGMGWTELSEYLAGALFGATLYAIIKFVSFILSVV